MTDSGPGTPSAPAPVEAGLKGLCPRCGARTLFAGVVRFAPKCRACGLDFERFNVGDGPAAFLTLGIGAIITILAVWVELAFEPPIWVHIILWVPLTLAGVLGALRLAKGMLITLEYRNAAREGRITPPSE
ncbi:DUF983 domain-containing protein [Stakelama marina]|uniref:DUF983 domain-containing protein n=1 Tax=Stakelama marina TaxID=2826939 RepID=A0A8T4IF60_9SPHN|nr:DUF983 domain-containing protein [Stakelama marina]MBR0552494.1 DUF983 domain-containing protein [Stakelama marina]